jgi:hypothetical protein
VCYKPKNLIQEFFHLMPPGRIRLKCRHVFTLIAVVFFLPASAEAQTGRVTLQGTVSETVALSVLPNSSQGNVKAEVTSSGNTVRITLSSADAVAPVIRVPLLVRSNSGFKISAAGESSAELSQLTITDVRATGALVSPEAISGLNVPPQFDLRLVGNSAPNSLDNSQPVLVASGPRVSLGGTLVSPNNALQITILIRLAPQPSPGWLVHLTFVATPE